MKDEMFAVITGSRDATCVYIYTDEKAAYAAALDYKKSIIEDEKTFLLEEFDGEIPDDLIEDDDYLYEEFECWACVNSFVPDQKEAAVVIC